MPLLERKQWKKRGLDGENGLFLDKMKKSELDIQFKVKYQKDKIFTKYK